MKRALVSVLLVALLAGGWLRPAEARDLPSGGMTADEVAAWLRDQNYPATVKPDPTTPGDQIISSTVDGINFDIYMYQCQSNRCRSLQYAAGWSSTVMTADRVNAWDRENRYCRAYMASSGAVWCEFDIDIDPGGTYESLTNSLARWREVLGVFKRKMVDGGSTT